MLLALMLALQAPSGDVTVTGQRLERVHDQCRQGRCTPLRDAQASIAWAEAQFRDGKYVAAKAVLRGAAERNKRHAATDPKPVSAIYEAYATVAWQEGDQDVYRDATAARVRTLRDNLPADDVYVRGAALALGDMWLRVRQPLEAQRAYEQAERDAVASGHGDVALRARLARAGVRRLFGDRAGAAALLASADTLPGAGEPSRRATIRATASRLAAGATARGGSGDDAAGVDRVAAEVGQAGMAQPVLVWAPPYPLDASDGARGVGRSATGGLGGLVVADGPRGSDLDGIRWADIAFRILPDGRTADVEVLRGSTDRGWTAPYLTQIVGRRYATRPAGTDDPAAARVERFTLRANYAVPIGSLIRRRAGPGKLEILDLSDGVARVTAAR